MIRPGRRLRFVALVALVLAGTAAPAPPATAAATVIANRLRAPVRVVCTAGGGAPVRVEIRPAETATFWGDGVFHATISRGGEAIGLGYQLDPYAAYFLVEQEDGEAVLGRIGLGEEADGDAPRVYPEATHVAATTPVVEIPVILYADEEQRLVEAVWRKEFTARVDAAAAFLEPFSGVRYRVRGTGRWTSDDELTELPAALKEFERLAEPPVGALALGFTSQFQQTVGRTNVGGSFGPFRSHVLMREWTAKIDEGERTELMIHELAHLLGASHSPEDASVMRPVVGRRFPNDPLPLRFDPANALIVACVGEEMRTLGARRLDDLSPLLLLRLHEMYAAIARSTPDDPTSNQMAAFVVRAGGSPRIAALRHVLRSIAHSGGAMNRDEGFADRRLGGYLRQAARAAEMTPPSEASQAFLLALGVGLDPSASIARSPLVYRLGPATTIRREAAAAAKAGPPALLAGRHDLAQHFAVSAALTALVGADPALQLGVAKEWTDAAGGSGFSFADLAADVAGVAFAEAVLADQTILETCAAGALDPQQLLPPIENLPEGRNQQEIITEFGGLADERFRRRLAAMRAEAQELVAAALEGDDAAE